MTYYHGRASVRFNEGKKLNRSHMAKYEGSPKQNKNMDVMDKKRPGDTYREY